MGPRRPHAADVGRRKVPAAKGLLKIGDFVPGFRRLTAGLGQADPSVVSGLYANDACLHVQMKSRTLGVSDESMLKFIYIGRSGCGFHALCVVANCVRQPWLGWVEF